MRSTPLAPLLLACLLIAGTGIVTAQESAPAAPIPSSGTQPGGADLLEQFNQEFKAQEQPPADSPKTLAEALKNLDVIAGRYPDNPKLLLALGSYLTNNDRVAEAYAVSDRLEKNPGEVSKADRLYLRHMIAFSERKFEKALELILATQVEEPDSYRTEFSKCQCLFLLYRFEEAEIAIATLVRSNPRAASSMSNLLDFQRYICLLKMGKADTEEAQSLVERYDYLSNDPVYYAKRALHSFEDGDRAEGMGWMNSLEKIYPAQISRLYLDCFFELGYLPHWNYPDRAQFNSQTTSSEAGASARKSGPKTISGPAGSAGGIIVPLPASGSGLGE